MIDEAHGIGVRQGWTRCGRPLRSYRRCRSHHGHILQVVCVAWRIYRYRQGDNQLPAPPLAFIYLHREHHSRIDSCRIGCHRPYGAGTRTSGKPLETYPLCFSTVSRNMGIEIGNTSTRLSLCSYATTIRHSQSPATFLKRASL